MDSELESRGLEERPREPDGRVEGGPEAEREDVGEVGAGIDLDYVVRTGSSDYPRECEGEGED